MVKLGTGQKNATPFIFQLLKKTKDILFLVIFGKEFIHVLNIPIKMFY